MQNLFADMGSPDFTGLNKIGQQARADEGIMAMKSDAMVDNAHMSGAAEVAMADAQAGVIGAQAAAAQQAAIGQGIGQIGSMLAGGIGGMGGGGGITSYDQIPSAGMKGLEPNSYMGTGGKYGSFKPVNMFGGN